MCETKKLPSMIRIIMQDSNAICVDINGTLKDGNGNFNIPLIALLQEIQKEGDKKIIIVSNQTKKAQDVRTELLRVYQGDKIILESILGNIITSGDVAVNCIKELPGRPKEVFVIGDLKIANELFDGKDLTVIKDIDKTGVVFLSTQNFSEKQALEIFLCSILEDKLFEDIQKILFDNVGESMENILSKIKKTEKCSEKDDLLRKFNEIFVKRDDGQYCINVGQQQVLKKYLEKLKKSNPDIVFVSPNPDLIQKITIRSELAKETKVAVINQGAWYDLLDTTGVLPPHKCHKPFSGILGNGALEDLSSAIMFGDKIEDDGMLAYNANMRYFLKISMDEDSNSCTIEIIDPKTIKIIKTDTGEEKYEYEIEAKYVLNLLEDKNKLEIKKINIETGKVEEIEKLDLLKAEKEEDYTESTSRTPPTAEIFPGNPLSDGQIFSSSAEKEVNREGNPQSPSALQLVDSSTRVRPDSTEGDTPPAKRTRYR